MAKRASVLPLSDENRSSILSKMPRSSAAKMRAAAANSTQIARIAAVICVRLPRIRRIASNAPTSPIIASTVTSDVRPPKAISDPRLNAISGSRTRSGGQIAGRSTSART